MSPIAKLHVSRKTAHGCRRRQLKVCEARGLLGSVLPMTQLFFGQQSEGYDDQAATGISCQRRVEAEEQPVCNGDEEDAQSGRLSV